MSIVNKYAQKVIALSNFEREKTQAETKIILDIIGEAVITHTDNGIHFINEAALQILNFCAGTLDSQSDDALAELEFLKQNQGKKAPGEDRRQIQNKILESKFLRVYSKNGEVIKDERAVSICDLMDSAADIAGTVFSCQGFGQASETRYFSVKVCRLEMFANHFTVVNLQDQTSSILFNLSKGEKQILQLINACVSHEMRNPINSILATNLKLKDCAAELMQLLRRVLARELANAEAAEMQEHCEQILAITETQESSTKLLKFYVGDLLSLA